MSTSLAEQLQRLAVPQTTRLQRDKKRASLLFDPKEAANLDKETAYQIGIDGLEELKERNLVFAEFENTLFHITSKDFERSVETAEANQKLDKNIRRFLLLLSPHFMFNCSYKALEWLVHRYYIHEYNKEELLMLILPYHETNIFVRTLQLLNLKNPRDKWHWLKPLQKTGVHLTKQVLYTNLAMNAHFLECISSYVLHIIMEHTNPAGLTTIFNFYCSGFVGALEYKEKVDEVQASQMLPVLLEGLSSNVPDFTASSYIVCAQLLSKAQLSNKILNKFTEKICQMRVTHLKSEAILLLLVLFQTQKHHKSMSNINTLIRHVGVTKILQRFNAEGMYIYPLVTPILKGCIEEVLWNNGNNMYKEFIDSILNEVKFDDGFIHTLVVTILEICGQQPKCPQDHILWLKEFLHKIEKQYSVAYNSAITQIIKPTQQRTQIQRTLRKLLGDITNLDSVYNLMEKLYHSNSQIRLESVKFLRKNLNILKDKDTEAIENAILDRINDDSNRVVCRTLNEFKSIFGKIVNMERLKNVLLQLLIRCRNDKEWLNVLPLTLDIVCRYYDECNVKVFLTILPFLLPTSEDELATAKVIVRSEYGKKSKFLAHLLMKLGSASSCAKFTSVVCKRLAESDHLPDATVLITMLKETVQCDALHKYMGLLLLCNALPSTIDFGVACLVLDIFEIYMSQLVLSQTEPKMSDYILLARKDKLSLHCLLDCIRKLLSKISKDDVHLDRTDFNASNDLTNFVLRLLKMLMKGARSSKPTKSAVYNTSLKNMFEHFCAGDPVKISTFLLNIVISDRNDELRLNCVETVKTVLNSVNVSNNGVVPYILIGLNLPNAKVRQELLDILNMCHSEARNDCNMFLNKFSGYHREVLMDHQQMPLAMHDIFVVKRKDVGVAFTEKLIDLLSATYPLYIKAGVLTLFSKINTLSIYTKTSKVAVEVLQNLKESGTAELMIINSCIDSFNSSIAQTLSTDSIIWEFLTLCIRYDKSLLEFTNGKLASPSALLLETIDREKFSQLKQNVQTLLLDEVIEVATNTENPEVSQAASHVFKRIDLDSSLVLEQLQKMRDVRSPTENPEKVKRRVNIVPTADILDTNNWKKGVTVLEFIQDKKKIKNTNSLLSVLFEILKKCLDFEVQANVEYPKQLLLSTILHCCQKIEDEKVPENAIDMQLVVQCIRASQNPQTHHHALLLLAEIASLIPKQVLHHIIAIFTFMGSSVLRHDDEYSFQIITKIIDTVIPILIEDGTTESVAQVLRVFVDAILDIPEHRRMRLFKQLLTRLNAKENLYLFLVIIFEAQVVHGQGEKQKTNKSRSLLNFNDAPKRLDIAADLCREFAPKTVISTCIKVLQYLCKLPEEKKNNTQNVDDYTFDIQRYNPKQLRHYKYIIILFIANLLSSKQFIMQVAALSDDEMHQLENLFKEAVIIILKYIQTTTKVAESNVDTPQAQYWKVILHYSCDMLDAINALLTEKMFLLVIRGLMVYSLSTIRKRALDLLNNKLQHKTDFISECDKDELYTVIVTPLVNIVKTIEEPEVDSDQEQVIQKALLSLKLIVKNLAADNVEKFIPILDFTAELVQTRRRKINDNVLASLILCVAELCDSLRAHSISSLHKCMPVILKLLKPEQNDTSPSLLLTSTVAALHKILDSLALFLSPFLKKLLCGISVLASRWYAQSDDPKLSAFVAKLHNVQQKLGQTVPLRVLLPAVETSYTALVSKTQFDAVEPLMKVLCESLNTMKGSDIQGYLTDLTNFFLHALQFRTESQYENVDEIEENIIKAIGTLVLKLSESTFRPLYFKIFDWAVRTDVKTERIITFYNLSYVFANCLKGLFSLFAGHFLNNAATLLDACNCIKPGGLYFEDEAKSIALVENILKTLHTIFMYDSQKFVSKERFEVLMQPIVDQLENTLGGVDCLETRAATILTPCIVQFAIATADDALWKQMNYQILLKTRHNTSKIRLIALGALGETAKKLGEDFLPLLPETIPFLAELLEDEDETVEKSCQKMLQELEKVLGEPLQKYF